MRNKKWKEEEKRRREKEKQQFNALINGYDQVHKIGERENPELITRLKELEGFFCLIIYYIKTNSY